MKRTLDKVGYEGVTGETVKKYGYDSFTELWEDGGLTGGYKLVPGVDHVCSQRGKITQCQSGVIRAVTDYFDNFTASGLFTVSDGEIADALIKGKLDE